MARDAETITGGACSRAWRRIACLEDKIVEEDESGRASG